MGLARGTWMVMVFLLGLAACQSNPTYQAYPGPAKSAKEEARVLIPQEFNLLNVNGNSYNQPLIGHGTIVKLLPGSHKIVIKYLDFWDISSETSERVASQPFLLAFDAKAGENYRIEFRELKDVKAAKAFAKHPEVSLVNAATNSPIAAEVRYQLEDKGLIASFMDSLSATEKKQPAAESDTEENRVKGQTALEMLKYWWQKADAQQQEDFMKWIVE